MRDMIRETSVSEMEREDDCRRKNEAEEYFAAQESKEEGESDKEGAKEGYPHPLEDLVEGVRRDSQGVMIQNRRHICKQLCRWLQPKWEICIIFGYLTRYILK